MYCAVICSNLKTFSVCILFARQDRPTTSEKLALAQRIIETFPVLRDSSAPNGYVCRIFTDTLYEMFLLCCSLQSFSGVLGNCRLCDSHCK